MQFGNHLIHNIYYMLAYAFEQLPNEFYEPTTTGEKFDNIFDILAHLLTVRLNKQIKQGLYREYIDFHEELPALRGRIDVAGIIQSRLSKRKMIVCEYDDLSMNNIYNQIIRTTCEFLLRSKELNEKRSVALNKALYYLYQINPIIPKTIRWETLHYSRNNRSYKETLNICRFILTNLLPSTEMGENKLSKYWTEERIHALYESFIRCYYNKHYPQLNAAANHIKWATSEEDQKNLPNMKTDITLHGEHHIFIIDAKYYGSILTKDQYGSTNIRSTNMYQIFSYVMNQSYAVQNNPNINGVSGMLLYASTLQENSFQRQFTIAGHRFYIDTLDLNQDFSQIANHLNSIVYPLLSS